MMLCFLTERGALRLQVTDDAASLNRDHNGLEVYQTVPSLSMSFKDYNDFKTKADVDAVDAELSKIDSKVIPYRRNRMVFFHSDLWHRTDGTAFKPGFKVSALPRSLLCHSHFETTRLGE